MRGRTEHSLDNRGTVLSSSVPGTGGGRAWGENGPFWTIFRATAAAGESNPTEKKRHPRHLPCRSNALLIGRNGGQLRVVLSPTLLGFAPGRAGAPGASARYAFALLLAMLCLAIFRSLCCWSFGQPPLLIRGFTDLKGVSYPILEA